LITVLFNSRAKILYYRKINLVLKSRNIALEFSVFFISISCNYYSKEKSSDDEVSAIEAGFNYLDNDFISDLNNFCEAYISRG